MEDPIVSDPTVRPETTLEYFKTQVEAACERQGVQPLPLTSYYIVNLLAQFTHLERSTAGRALGRNRPLAMALVEALQGDAVEQRQGLRQVGDLSLFVSGFFGDSLRRSLVDVDYYVSLGGYAYGSLGRDAGDPLAEAFEELSEKFVSFVDVLSEVSERSTLTSTSDVMRLYERWVRTGSRLAGELLIERGLLPNAAARKARVQ
jgi:hypothetical protein